MNPSVEVLSKRGSLTFTRLNVGDRVQFWCPEINASIFVSSDGVQISGPDLWNATLVSAERYAEIHPVVESLSVDASKFKDVYGTCLSGDFKGRPGKLNGLYNGKVVVLCCDYSGRFAHIPPEELSKFFEPYPSS